MARIIGDAVRRLFWMWVVVLVLLTTVWVLALRPGVPPTLVRLAYAFSFYVDLFIFIQLKHGPESPSRLRLVQTLPVSRADLARGAWMLAVIGTSVVTMSAKTLAVGIIGATSIHTPVDLTWLMFSGIFDVAWAGSMCWLPRRAIRAGIAIGVGRQNTTRRDGPGHVSGSSLTRKTRALVAVLSAAGVIFLVYLAGALALAFYTPLGWDQWRWHTGLILAGMLGLTATGAVQAVRFAARAMDTPRPISSAPREEPSRIATLVPRVRFGSRLGGLRRMLWLQFRSALVISVIAMSLLVVAGAAPYSRTRGFWDQLRDGVQTMPAEIGAELWVMGWFLCLAIGVSRWAPSKLPLLKTLPISSREINLILLLRTVVTCAAFWLAVFPIYLLSPVSTHPWMGLGWLVALIGVSALWSAARAQWQRSPRIHLIVLGINYLMIFGRQWTHINSIQANTAAVEFDAFALGTCAIGATFIWNQRLLTGSGGWYGRANWIRSKS